MTAMAVEPGLQWSYLLDTWRELDVPEGWRAEIDEGKIALVPPPGVGHNMIAEEVHWALKRCLPRSVGVYQTLGTEIVPLEKLYMPDLVVVDKALLDPEDSSVDAGAVMMAVEITSKDNARQDRTKKLWAYAHAPVSLYLLIDRFDPAGPTVTLFEEPENGAYRRTVRASFGEPVKLPDPFGVELVTKDFPAAAKTARK
ncbi:Uma2 family endonuclease [Kitasatospora sp. GP30]|nr:Uma2 family endonuclease [Kitasatospora sp. GP30]